MDAERCGRYFSSFIEKASKLRLNTTYEQRVLLYTEYSTHFALEDV